MTSSDIMLEKMKERKCVSRKLENFKKTPTNKTPVRSSTAGY